jgi:hypothetical protein
VQAARAEAHVEIDVSKLDAAPQPPSCDSPMVNQKYESAAEGW